METKVEKIERLKRILGKHILEMDSGIFRTETRKKILGIKKQPEPGLDRNQFWYKRRKQVERALIDLTLFIEVSGKKNVNQVITQESLRPVVSALLWHPIVDRVDPDVNLAEIAQLLIESGFSYLREMFRATDRHLPLSSQRTIEEAVDLSKYLVSQVDDRRKAARERRE